MAKININLASAKSETVPLSSIEIGQPFMTMGSQDLYVKIDPNSIVVEADKIMVMNLSAAKVEFLNAETPIFIREVDVTVRLRKRKMAE